MGWELGKPGGSHAEWVVAACRHRRRRFRRRPQVSPRLKRWDNLPAPAPELPLLPSGHPATPPMPYRRHHRRGSYNTRASGTYSSRARMCTYVTYVPVYLMRAPTSRVRNVATRGTDSTSLLSSSGARRRRAYTVSRMMSRIQSYHVHRLFIHERLPARASRVSVPMDGASSGTRWAAPARARD